MRCKREHADLQARRSWNGTLSQPYGKSGRLRACPQSARRRVPSIPLEVFRRLALPSSNVTVLEVIQRSAEFLNRKGVDSPRLQVELLLAHVLQMPRLRLYLDFERRLSDTELDAVRTLVKRRASREPLQHIVGSTSFCGLDIKVDRHVLIPRPETEGLAELGWEFLRTRDARDGGTVTALDMGTGSGCLAVALAVHAPSAEVWAVDISPLALAVARGNAARLGVLDRIRFLEGDRFSTIPPAQRFDVIVSNPPYIPTAEIEGLASEVRDHDPRLALDGGTDGLEFFRQLALEARQRLRPGGRFLAEFGDGQGPALQTLFEQNGWNVVEIVRDLSGRARILVACGSES